MSHDDFNARYSLHASQVGTHNLDLGGTDVSQEEHESTVQYLVRLKDGTNMTVHFLGLDRLNVDLSSTRSFYTVVHKFKQSFLLGYIVYFNSKHLSKFQNQSDILHLEKDSDIILETVIMQPDAPWGLARINEASPIDTTKEKFNYIYDNAYETGEGVNIYVFDSGLKSEHVQFGGRVKAAYVHRGGTSGDTDGHGTHVAGIIAGATYGVAKNSTLYECKVLPDGETGTVGKLLMGMEWLATHFSLPAIANISLSASRSEILNEGAGKLTQLGIHVIVAAGNQKALAHTRSPASASTVITVGTLDRSDTPQQDSNHGSSVSVFAPGTHILSCGVSSTTATATKSGSSMAAAFVSGIVATVISLRGNLSCAKMKKLLVELSIKGAVKKLKPDTPNRIARGCIHSQVTLSINRATEGSFGIEQDYPGIISTVDLSVPEAEQIHFQNSNQSVKYSGSAEHPFSLSKFVVVSAQSRINFYSENGIGIGGEGEIVAEFSNGAYKHSAATAVRKVFEQCDVTDTSFPARSSSDADAAKRHTTSQALTRKRLLMFCDGTGQDGMIGTNAPTCSDDQTKLLKLIDPSQAYQHGVHQVLAANAGLSLDPGFPHPPVTAPYVTNVLRLSRAVKRWSNDDRMRQIVFYQSGVGSEANFTGEMHQTSWYIQMRGVAVASKIRDAYAFLAQNFEAGDEILLFGFGRGAYTVRKLAQLIDKIGLLETENLGLFYQIWRELVDGKPPTIPEKTRVTTIKCLGVWDTVGVKDEPAALHIADTIVPSNVERALHAVSLQENRAEFSPTLFTLPSRSNQILKEYWFPGSNLGVGGSYEHHELADIALFWMAGEILNDSLFDFDEKFLLRSKQPAPRAPWGASIPHNAWNDTFMLWKNYSWVFTQQTRLESGDITATAQFHHSWVYAPNDIPHDHMITREILEKEFGHLTYQPLNDWENERRLNWNSETNDAPVIYDDARALFPTALGPCRWMTKSDTKPKGLEAVPLGKETGGRMKYVGNIYYEGALHPGNFDLSPTTFYITIANSGKEVMITEGPSLRFLMVPSDTVAWFRVTGYQRWGKRTGIQNPVRTGGDVRWPRYSVRTFHDGGIVGGEVEPDHDPIFPYRGSTFTVGEYHILVYKSELYGFHNAIGQYRTENKWFTVTAGSTNSVWVPFTPAEMENPIILTTISMIYMEKDSKTVRVNAYADFVSTTDFHVHVDTWATSILYNADVSWLKISNGDPDFRTGVFSCTGGIITSVDFNWSFDDPPEIFIGLTKIDLSANQDQGQNVDTAWRWHMKVSVDKVSRTGFRICVEQPRGTDAMHECKITWVAYPKGKPGVHSGTLQASNLSGSSIHKVAFPHPFKGRPMVLTAFTSFIIPASDHFRLRSEAYVWESGSGMDCVLATWAESTITWAEMSYLVLWPDQ